LLSSPTARRFGVGLFWESANFNSQQKSSAFSTDRQIVEKSNNSVFQQACTKHHLKMPPDLALYLRMTLRKTNSVQWRTGFLGGQFDN
jgi:hypothetical protein